MWIWTCRSGFEADLIEELNRAGRHMAPCRAGPAIVASVERPARWPTFARAGFPLASETREEPAEAASALAAALDAAFASRPRAWLLSAWVPDSEETNPLAPRVARLADAVAIELLHTRPDLAASRVHWQDEALRYGGWLGQICLVAHDRVLVGAIEAGESPSRAPGGRARARAPLGAPSRAARKLVEAFDWIGRAPEPGELCVDLGAAPGGWTAVLLGRRARVVAVDPANLAPSLRGRRGLVHIKASAFDYTPDEPVDWLLCDMAWRPLEVAALLAKWGRRRWASSLVANVKLPMKRRVEFVARVEKTVEEGGWRDVKIRHLYHDREEVTLAAWRM